MLLLFKAENVKRPGARGAKFRLDEHGNVRYDEKSVKGAAHKYIAKITLSDGTVEYVYPNENELDEKGQVTGQAAIREIINRELFGEYGFKEGGRFWQKRGLLIEYRTRTTDRGKVVVDPVQRHKGYTSFEFRDSSVARAYGGSEEGLPKKITQYKVEAQPREPVPTKDKIELPATGTHDRPLGGVREVHEHGPYGVYEIEPTIEELGIHNVPKRLPENRTSIGEPLTAEEDPLVIATAYLDASLRALKPSHAKTEAGQAKARADREGQFDEVVGKREISPLPMWAVNKFDSPAQLQHELSRTEGRPLTTLITLGIWNPDNKSKRVREQLLKEWAPFIRRWTRKFGSVFASTDIYREMDEVTHREGYAGKLAESSAKRYMYDRERDMFNEAVAVLLDQANKYVPNDEPKGQYSRFDLRAENAIKNHLEQFAKQAAIELGATALEDLHEEEEYKAPKMISPREHFELHHYEPIAKKIIREAIADLPPHMRYALESRLWMDDDDSHPDKSQEHAFNEQRARHQEKYGKAGLHWGRPWTGSEHGVSSIATKLAGVTVELPKGKKALLGTLSVDKQGYHLEKWYAAALEHVNNRLKTRQGGLTPDGLVVEKWLRLESKVAKLNRREIEDRTAVPVAQMPKLAEPKVQHVRAHEHPAITFFKQPGSNRDLAVKLGIANDLNLPAQIKNVTLPKQLQQKAEVLNEHYKLVQNLKQIPNLAPVHEQAHGTMQAAQDVGAWVTDAKGNTNWHEKVGVVQLHEAAVKLHNTKGADQEAVAQFTAAANALGGAHPMVKEYMSRLAVRDMPTSNDLATWKTRQHAAYRQHENRLHIVEFEQEQRKALKVAKGSDLAKAFAECIDAYDALSDILKHINIVKQPGSRGGIWYRNDHGDVVYGKQGAEDSERSNVARHVVDARERLRGHQKQLETHSYTEAAHRDQMKTIKEKMAALKAQKKTVDKKKHGSLDRKIAKLAGEHDEHKAVVTAVKEAKVKVKKELEAERIKRRGEVKTTYVETQKDLENRAAFYKESKDKAAARYHEREAKNQARADASAAVEREAITRIGHHRIGSDEENEPAVSASVEQQYADTPDFVIGNNQRIREEPEEPRELSPLEKLSKERPRYVHKPFDPLAGMTQAQKQQHFYEDDRRKARERQESVDRAHAKNANMSEEEKRRNREAKQAIDTQHNMRESAKKLPQGEFDAAPPVKGKKPGLLTRVASSVRKVFGKDAPVVAKAIVIRKRVRK